MGLLLFIFAMILFTKLMGFTLKITGKLLGAIFSLIGYLIIGSIAVSLLGVAFYIVIAGVIVCAIASGISAAV